MSAVEAVEGAAGPAGTSTLAKRLAVLFASSTIVLVCACGFLVWRIKTRPFRVNNAAALEDPRVREEVVQRLFAGSLDIWDSHNDPEVGRVLQANVRRPAAGVLTTTNALGLREREFALPKPADTLRIVFLGDSYVQAFGVEANERMGVFLEKYLAERAPGWKGKIECLHVGVGGWNVTSECAWLRRMLSDLAPDLVFHILISNDLDDHMGARGFGALSSFAPLAMRHTDALVAHVYPVRYSSSRNTNYLLLGADHESRHRVEELAAAIGRLVPHLRRAGVPYLAMPHWGTGGSLVWESLRNVLEPSEFVPLPARLLTESDLFHNPTDGHWSRKGHELVAQLCFTLIRDRNLLPALAPAAWPEIEEPRRAELDEAREASAIVPTWQGEPPLEGLESLEPARFTDLEWRHVYTGLDGEGRVSPFASFLLVRKESSALRLRGRAFDRPEIAGARVRITVQDVPVGEHELVPGEAFDVRFPLPKRVKRRGAVTVHLETSDYVYAGRNRQHCVSFELQQLALE